MDAPNPTLVTVSDEIKKYDEYYNIKDYYIKFYYTHSDEFNIICYNIVLLDGIKYELKMNLQKIYNLSDIFRQFTSMKNFYEFFIELINERKYELNKNKDNNLELKLIISDIKKNEYKISFILISDSNNNTQEYINILSNEIKNIRLINKDYNLEIKKLKKENEDFKNEIKEIKKLLLKYESKNEINKNEQNKLVFKSENNNNLKINLKAPNKGVLKIQKNEQFEKICSLCKSINNLRRCFCNKIFCENCLLNKKNESCKEEYLLFHNNLNKLNSLYNISKYPLPKNFEAKIHFIDVEMIRIGITFDSNIVNEKKDINAPNYKIYYILQDLNNFFSYHERKWQKFFKFSNKLKNGDDLTIILNKGQLKYLINGEDLGKSYPIESSDLDEEEMYLLIHRRNQYSQCEIKYICEIINN
jgi:hypothetical protein